MNWLKIQEDLPDHPKVIKAAAALNIKDRDTLVGKLVRFWMWMLHYRPSGQFCAAEIAVIAEKMCYKGSPQRLMDALASAGLLDFDGETYSVHDWHDYAGALLDSREKDKQRMRENRAAAKVKDIEPDEDEPCIEDRILDAYQKAFGAKLRSQQLSVLRRMAALNNVTDLLLIEAITISSHAKPNIPIEHIIGIMRKWNELYIRTKEELDEYNFLCACRDGRAPGMSKNEAIKRIDEGFRQRAALYSGSENTS